MPPLSSNEHSRVRRTARRSGPCRSAKLTDKIFFGPRPAEELYDLNQWKKACVNPESDRIRK
jgi:hypothetical protein